MGERINIYVGDVGRAGAVLFSNSCHPEVDAEQILRSAVKESIGPTSLVANLLARKYPSTVGSNFEGSRVFSVDLEPGDHEKVFRVTSSMAVVEETGDCAG